MSLELDKNYIIAINKFVSNFQETIKPTSITNSLITIKLKDALLAKLQTFTKSDKSYLVEAIKLFVDEFREAIKTKTKKQIIVELKKYLIDYKTAFDDLFDQQQDKEKLKQIQHFERNLDYLSQNAVELKLASLDQQEETQFNQQDFNDFVQQQTDERKLRQVQQSRQRRDLGKDFRRQMPKIRDDQTVVGQYPETYQLQQQIIKLNNQLDICHFEIKDLESKNRLIQEQFEQVKKMSKASSNYGKIDVDYIQFPSYYIISKYHSNDVVIARKPYPDGIEVFEYYLNDDRGKRMQHSVVVTKYNNLKYNVSELLNLPEDEYIIYQKIDDKPAEEMLYVGESCSCIDCNNEMVIANTSKGASYSGQPRCRKCGKTVSYHDSLCDECQKTRNSSPNCKKHKSIPTGTYSIRYCTNYGNIYSIKMNETNITKNKPHPSYTYSELIFDTSIPFVDKISIINFRLNNTLIDMIKHNFEVNYEFVSKYVKQLQ